MIHFFKNNLFKEELSSLNEFYHNYDFNIRNKVSQYFIQQFRYPNFSLTKSCTQSLELAIMSLNLPRGSEVIIPSYGFVSLANAVIVNGLKCVFVDCDPETMNINSTSIFNAISPSTSAIITINYGGVACDYDLLIPFCKDNKIILIEDNAHGIFAKYKDQYLGNFGDISTISFDFMKNISCNEGGGITINNLSLVESFYKSYFFGTNKKDFVAGNVNFYEWQSAGTNAILAEHLSVILLAQLSKSKEICKRYLDIWNTYYENLLKLEDNNFIELPKIPDYAGHNAHIFWIKVKNNIVREKLTSFMANEKIELTFHYVPLHSSAFGKNMGEFRGEDKFTTKDSSRLLRLPIYFSLTDSEQSEVIDKIYRFFKKINLI